MASLFSPRTTPTFGGYKDTPSSWEWGFSMGASASMDSSNSGKHARQKFPAPVKDGDAVVFAAGRFSFVP